MAEPNYWWPETGKEVRMNHPDHDAPPGVAAGFNPDDTDHRPGQPTTKKADSPHINCHPHLLPPFKMGSPKWEHAEAEGRVG